VGFVVGTVVGSMVGAVVGTMVGRVVGDMLGVLVGALVVGVMVGVVVGGLLGVVWKREQAGESVVPVCRREGRSIQTCAAGLHSPWATWWASWSAPDKSRQEVNPWLGTKVAGEARLGSADRPSEDEPWSATEWSVTTAAFGLSQARHFDPVTWRAYRNTGDRLGGAVEPQRAGVAGPAAHGFTPRLGAEAQAVVGRGARGQVALLPLDCGHATQRLPGDGSPHGTRSQANAPSPLPPVTSIHMSKAVFPLASRSCPMAGTAITSATHRGSPQHSADSRRPTPRHTTTHHPASPPPGPSSRRTCRGRSNCLQAPRRVSDKPHDHPRPQLLTLDAVPREGDRCQCITRTRQPPRETLTSSPCGLTLLVRRSLNLVACSSKSRVSCNERLSVLMEPHLGPASRPESAGSRGGSRSGRVAPRHGTCCARRSRRWQPRRSRRSPPPSAPSPSPRAG
jgi:hypothetical protein